MTARSLPEGSRRLCKTHGYAFTKVLGTWVREHMFVYRVLFGDIPADCVVHHKDEDKANNAPANLALLTFSEHARLHHIGSKRSDATKQRLSSSAKDRALRPEERRLRSERAKAQHEAKNFGACTWISRNK